MVSGPRGDTGSVTSSVPLLSMRAVAGFFFFGFFFFFFLGPADRPSSSSSSMSSTVAFVDRCAGTGTHDKLKFQSVGSVTQRVLYRWFCFLALSCLSFLMPHSRKTCDLQTINKYIRTRVRKLLNTSQ